VLSERVRLNDYTTSKIARAEAMLSLFISENLLHKRMWPFERDS